MSDERAEAVRRICEALERRGGAALGNRPAPEVAAAWVAAGYDDPEEVDEWLDACVFDPAGARRVEDAGFTAQQAAARTRAGAGGVEDTIGHKLIRGDLSFDEARRIITSDFWNT